MESNVDEDGRVLVAAVEGGGTTFVLCVAWLHCQKYENVIHNNGFSGNDIDLSQEQIEVLETTSIPSDSNPQRTLDQCCAWLSARRPIDGSSFGALGVACFGPLGLDPTAPHTYGHILTSSPKKEWRDVDVLGPLLQACRGGNDTNGPPPHRLDTDVNAPAVAEFSRRQRQQQQSYDKSTHPIISSLAYVTVGTGIGVGLVVNSLPVHGRMHPEGGHVCVAPLPNDSFQGYSWGKQSSPYGGIHTVEGIASSVALTERVAARNSDNTGTNNHHRNDLALLDDDDEVWDHAANALANLCVSLILMLSMEEIVLGGGIMKRTILFGKIRKRVKEILRGYVDIPDEKSTTFIRAATWGNSSGLVGALMLARKAYENDMP